MAISAYVDIADLGQSLPALMDRVRAGEEVAVLEHGAVVARIVPPAIPAPRLGPRSMPCAPRPGSEMLNRRSATHGKRPMVILDTCALIYDALTPDRLSEPARTAIERADSSRDLACWDASLWEVAMLAEHGRIDHGAVLVTSDRRLRDARQIPTLW